MNSELIFERAFRYKRRFSLRRRERVRMIYESKNLFLSISIFVGDGKRIDKLREFIDHIGRGTARFEKLSYRQGKLSLENGSILRVDYLVDDPTVTFIFKTFLYELENDGPRDNEIIQEI